jgi:aminopeptidase N
MRYIIAALLLGITATASRAEAPFSFETVPGRLPKEVRPSAYRIDVALDLKALTIKGREEIDLDVAQKTSRFVLDQAGLSVARAWLAGDEASKAEISIDQTAETVTLNWPHPIEAGKHVLIIEYRGPIPETPAGLYYNDYTANGARDRMLVTQFEQSDARRLFPSWDEPAFKASFQLTIAVPDDLVAVSNMPIRTEAGAGTDARGNRLKRIEFQPTPVMSSYLLALAVGHLEVLRGETAGVGLGVWTAAGRSEEGEYALHAASEILPFYNEYFGVPYPLPKLDLIAVPGNFSAGAMENWGAITFIDDDLLYDKATSSPHTREEVFLVVAHEMAHLWSGDLDTLGWWDNVWLNEGFASWMENNATDRFNPDWKIWLRARESKEIAMAKDATKSTHPLQQRIDDESESGNEFDEISYDKGAAVIRMIENWLGPDRFRAGMRDYMKAHAYSNTTSADLWSALEGASGEQVAAVAGTFTEQPGVPLLRVAQHCVDGKTEIALTQARFLRHGAAPSKEAWRIPVRLGAGDQAVSVVVPPAGLTTSLAGCDRPIQANLGDFGYYRVAYDDAVLARLAAGFAGLQPADRTVLIGDQWALAESGDSEIGSYLNLTRNLGGETELAVWTPVINHLTTMDRLEIGQPDLASFRRYAVGLLRPVLARLGWDPKPGESDGDALLRADVIAALGQFGDPDVVAEAGRRFKAFEADPKSLAPGISSAVLRTVGRTADAAVWDRLRALGRAAPDTETKLRYYDALAGASDPALIDRLVAITTTDEISPGRIGSILRTAAAESGAPLRVWHGVIAHAHEILGKMTADDRPEFLAKLSESTGDPAVAAELAQRPEMQESTGAKEAAANAAEIIAVHDDLRQRFVPAIGAWLRQAG